MAIVIKSRKIVIDATGVPGRLILAIRALSKEKLPKEYLADSPNCYIEFGQNPLRRCLRINAVNGVSSKNDYLWEGGIYPEDRFHRAIKSVKACGEHLAKINMKRKALEARWHGEEKIVI